MPSLISILVFAAAAYALVTTIFIISENRRPQATLAWMLAFYAVPVLGLLVYFFFGRDRKMFSRERQLLRQNLEPSAQPLLAPLLAGQEAESAALADDTTLRRRLVMLVRRNSTSALVRARTVEILQDASSFYPRLIEDMKAARHSIHHQYFIWGADGFTRELKEIMIAKSIAGVRVRLLFDPVGSLFHLDRAYLAELRAAGVEVKPTSPLYRLHTLNYRNHRKITVIDGAVGFTGGMNIGQQHLDGGPGFDSWRDTQLRTVGDAAAVLQAVFAIDWFNATGANLFAPEYFPRLPPPSKADGIPIQILTSGPDAQWAAIRQLYAFMVGSARRRVLIQSPFFVPDATLAEALSLAAMAGVDVSLMISARPSGTRLPDWAGNTFFLDVVAAGVRVFLYEKGYLHAKTIAVDGEVCSIGSANINSRSFGHDYELNAVLYEASLTRELEVQFEADLQHCREFDPDEYARRPRPGRFRDSAVRLLAPLL